jgi:hypothetical protein
LPGLLTRIGSYPFPDGISVSFLVFTAKNIGYINHSCEIINISHNIFVVDKAEKSPREQKLADGLSNKGMTP